MIAPTTTFTIALVPLSRILLTEYQARDPERVLFYYRLLTDPRYVDGYHPGVIHLTPHTRTVPGEDLYTILDGHHRYLASVMAGRAHVLALIHSHP